MMVERTHVPVFAIAALVACMQASAFAQVQPDQLPPDQQSLGVDERPGPQSVAPAQIPPDQGALFTFSEGIEVPGATLPPGKYVFRLPAPDSSARVVQVLSAEGEKKVHGMFFSVPVNRLEAPPAAEISFLEMPEGMPRAAKIWWQPGKTIGYEFIYPRQQAQRLASAGKRPVLTTKAQTTMASQTNVGPTEHISPAGESVSVDPDDTYSATARPGMRARGDQAGMYNAPASGQTSSTPKESITDPSGYPIAGPAASASATASTPSASGSVSAPSTSAQARTPSASASASSGAMTQAGRSDAAAAEAGQTPGAAAGTAAARRQLPQTASPMPLVGLAGLIALVAGGALFGLRRRHS